MRNGMKRFTQISRRKFFRRFIYTLLSLQVVYFIVRLLKPGYSQTAQDDYYEAGEVSFFEAGRIYPFSSKNFFLHRLPDGGFLALSSKCTHLGCTIQFLPGENRFECPCHASAFNKTGEVLSAPATRTLDYFPVVIANNKVLVDTNNALRRDRFNRSQVIYA